MIHKVSKNYLLSFLFLISNRKYEKMKNRCKKLILPTICYARIFTIFSFLFIIELKEKKKPFTRLDLIFEPLTLIVL